MTGTQIVTAARQLLDDANKQSWSDDKLLEWINLAVRTITRLRPDSLYDASGDLITISDISALGDTVSLSTDWREHIVWYVVGAAYSMEAGDERDRKNSDQAMNMFRTLITS